MDTEQNTDRFYRVIWPHAAMVLRAAQMLCHHRAEADDLAQETLLKAYRYVEGFRDGTNAKAWILRILRNARIDQLRSKRAESGTIPLNEDTLGMSASVEIDACPDPATSTDAATMLESFSDAEVITALKELPEEIRVTLLLVDVEGMVHADAAAVLEIPVGTVKSRAHRGRAMLRTSLASHAKELRLIR